MAAAPKSSGWPTAPAVVLAIVPVSIVHTRYSLDDFPFLLASGATRPVLARRKRALFDLFVSSGVAVRKSVRELLAPSIVPPLMRQVDNMSHLLSGHAL